MGYNADILDCHGSYDQVGDNTLHHLLIKIECMTPMTVLVGVQNNPLT